MSERRSALSYRRDVKRISRSKWRKRKKKKRKRKREAKRHVNVVPFRGAFRLRGEREESRRHLLDPTSRDRVLQGPSYSTTRHTAIRGRAGRTGEPYARLHLSTSGRKREYSIRPTYIRTFSCETREFNPAGRNLDLSRLDAKIMPALTTVDLVFPRTSRDRNK